MVAQGLNPQVTSRNEKPPPGLSVGGFLRYAGSYRNALGRLPNPNRGNRTWRQFGLPNGSPFPLPNGSLPLA